MFSRNQVLSISNELTMDAVRSALCFALDMAGAVVCEDKGLCWQVDSEGRYCIGWYKGNPAEGWNTFGFASSLDNMSMAVMKHLLVVGEVECSSSKGTYVRGFCMDVIRSDEDSVKSSSYGYVAFKQYTCRYDV